MHTRHVIIIRVHTWDFHLESQAVFLNYFVRDKCENKVFNFINIERVCIQ